MVEAAIKALAAAAAGGSSTAAAGSSAAAVGASAVAALVAGSSQGADDSFVLDDDLLSDMEACLSGIQLPNATIGGTKMRTAAPELAAIVQQEYGSMDVS